MTPGIASRLTAVSLFALFAAPAMAGTGQPSPWQINMQGAVTPIAEQMHGFNTFITIIMVVVVLFVLALLIVCAVRFNEKKNPVPSRTTHNTLIEVVWTIAPVIILIVIAVPSFRLLFAQYDMPVADLTIKATGKQWYWSYEYQTASAPTGEAAPAEGSAEAPQAAVEKATDPEAGALDFGFDSVMVQEADLKEGQPRLLATDNDVVVPVGKVVRVQVTAADVIHSFAVPSFGIKVDGVPGRLNETWFRADREGVYYGQCSELCGRDHAFMPITVRVVSEAEYAVWLNEARQKFAMNPMPQIVADATVSASR
ncbi:cytochrome c oxidase subunit II [Terrihabitans sp. B22-R8]|uniref:cytochrome c oxidase subunit II n=1 Tax=Terrihabitans sp. B22-R8 TaxID=3425128 RepID=UPI00403D31A7